MPTLRSHESVPRKIALINGPNMSQLGRRRDAYFGDIKSLDDLSKMVDEFAETLNISVSHYTSEVEGEILRFIHKVGEEVDAFIINPAGLTHFGQATRDALLDTGKPYVEVHFANLSVWISNVAPGLPVGSIFSHTAAGVIEGLRHYGYFAALLALGSALDDPSFLGQSGDE